MEFSYKITTELNKTASFKNSQQDKNRQNITWNVNKIFQEPCDSFNSPTVSCPTGKKDIITA